MTAAEYDTPLAKKHHETPKPAMTRPRPRADHPGGHEHCAAQAHRVAHVLGAHHLDDDARRAGLSKAFTAPRPRAST